MNSSLPFYILIRTSKRPKFFAEMMASIKAQTYPNIITIVHTDDPNDTYAIGDIIIKGKLLHKTKEQTAPYNLYNNRLLQAIPEGPGYYHFIDDDDKYMSPNVIEKTVAKCDENKINVVRVKRWGSSIWPKTWGSQTSYQTECFILHTKHKNLAKWWDKKGGDHNYSKQITRKLAINWIDGIIICKAQEGKGHGNRFDLGESKNSVSNTANGIEPPDRTLVNILFRVCIRFPQECKGREGEVKQIPLWRAKLLEAQQRIIINPTATDISKAKEALKHRMPLTEGAFQKQLKMSKKK